MTEWIRITPGFGAVASEMDVRRVDGTAMAELRKAFSDHKLLVFPAQHLEAEELLAFGRRWGVLDKQELAESVHPAQPEVQILEHDADHPPTGYQWHTDLSWSERPPAATILSAKISPLTGGDTVFCDMGAVYSGLSSRMQGAISGLSARHDRLEHLVKRQLPAEQIVEFLKRHPPVDHPVVRSHPETGERLVYVNQSFTKYINGIPENESKAILNFLFAETHRVEYQCRVRWAAGAVVIWDNRVLQHNAVADYYPEHRRMERVVIAGDTPK